MLNPNAKIAIVNCDTCTHNDRKFRIVVRNQALESDVLPIQIAVSEKSRPTFLECGGQMRRRAAITPDSLNLKLTVSLSHCGSLSAP